MDSPGQPDEHLESVLGATSRVRISPAFTKARTVSYGPGLRRTHPALVRHPCAPGWFRQAMDVFLCGEVPHQ